MYSFVNAALKANSWTFDAKTKAIKIWPETKAWPPGLHRSPLPKGFDVVLEARPWSQAKFSWAEFIRG